jgi:cytochrome c553
MAALIHNGAPHRVAPGTLCLDTCRNRLQSGREARMAMRLSVTIFAVAIGVAVSTGTTRADDDIEAKVQVCGACHGQNGVPTDPKTVPIIWGQQESYLVKQLHDYRSGDRDNPVMSSIAKGLAQEDLRKIAAYFAAKSWPTERTGTAPESPPKAIAQCQPCHQPNFEGGMPAPRLAGLSYEYLDAAMGGFATNARTNNLDMPKFMRALTDSERDAIARYLSAL